MNSTVRQGTETSFLGGRVVALVGDITEQSVDAIVNAANSTLLGGGGVDGAIHRAGGPDILKECKELRRALYPKGLPTGQAIITSAGDLPARFVIHTVGPIFGRDEKTQERLLGDCYQNSLLLASNHKLSSIAFPSISTGAFGYPRDKAALISSTTIKETLENNEIIQLVRLVFFQPGDLRVFLQYQIFE